MSPRHNAHRFFILRHGETNWNASGIIQGSSDASRLTARGKAQAAQVGQDVFSSLLFVPPMDEIYVSPLTRAQETLVILRKHAAAGMLPPSQIVLNDLREIDLYSWEGQSVSDLRKRDKDAYQAWKVANAQSFVVNGRLPIVETWRRAEHVWNVIRQQQQKQQERDASNESAINSTNTSSATSKCTLLVCHGTLGQALLCTAFGWDEGHFREHEFPNCGLVEIAWSTEENIATSWKWHYPNQTERLHPTVDTTLA